MWPGEVRVIRALRYLLPWLLVLPALPVDITHERKGSTPAVNHAHPYMPLCPLASVFRALPDLRHHLSRVTCPVLVVAARHDHVVPGRDGIEVFARIGSAHKELLMLKRSFHAVLHDVEQERVEQRIAAFCQVLRATGEIAVSQRGADNRHG
jgi:pimeloyl-ACP methyl ester carboxylesterase